MAAATPGSNTQAKEWSEVYEEIKHDYDLAYKLIDQGIKLDEEGNTREAVEKYEFGLNIIDKALAMPLECPENPDISWEKAYVMIQKMRKTRKEMTIRMSNAQAQPDPAAAVPPPSYEEAMASSPPVPSDATEPALCPGAAGGQGAGSNGTPSYSELTGQLGQMQVEAAREVLYSHSNVRMYFIAPDGRVSAPSDPTTLTIARIYDPTATALEDAVSDIVRELQSEGYRERHRRHRHRRHHRRHGRRHHRDGAEEPAAQQDADLEPGLLYLQVGAWLYPLIPGVSPCYRTDFGALILPDVNSGVEGAAVGIILPGEADESVHQLLQDILNCVTDREALAHPQKPPRFLRGGSSTPQPPQPYVSSPLANSLVRGASYLASNIVRGAGNTARLIDSTTPKLLDHIQPRPQPTAVNPTVRKSVEVAKNVSGTAANVTGYLATKLGVATAALGRYLAPHVQRQGTRLLTSTTRMSQEEAAHKVDSVLDVTSGAVESIATVYTGLQTSAAMLGRSLSNNTVQIIQHKYGDPAGAVTSDAFSTLGSVYTVRDNMRVLQPKGFAKSAAKGAGGAMLEDHRAALRGQKPHEEFPGPGPGDGSGFKKEPL